jgi:DNA-binding transcriptional ArsR family regulator
MFAMSDDQCDLLCIDLPLAERLRNARLSSASARQLTASFKALSDPTRLTIAAALAEAEELCVCDLSWIAERPENLVSHHLRQLLSAGLVTRRREGKMMMYALNGRGRELLAVAEAPVGAHE